MKLALSVALTIAGAFALGFVAAGAYLGARWP